MLDKLDPTVRGTLDVASVTVVGLALMDWLPPLAAGLSIVWVLIQIGESRTFHRFCRWVRGIFLS